MLRMDLHVHTRYSPDSRLGVETAVDSLGPLGLQGFALTDHNTLAGHARIAELRQKYPRYWFLPGMEATAREGHVLLYGLSEAPPRDLPLVELLEWARPRNVVAVLAHPFRWVHGVGRRLSLTAPVDGIEVRNGRSSELANARAEFVAAHRGLSATGGSDAHEISTLGRAFTEFPEEFESVEQILEAMRRRQCSAQGRSLSIGGRVSLAFRNSLLRAGRGFRAV